MKAKDTPCSTCGGRPEIHGSDIHDEGGPWYVCCSKCGKETLPWAYQREAWQEWKYDNEA